MKKITLILSIFLLISCSADIDMCSENSSAVTRVKSLSKTQLKTLIKDARKFYNDKDSMQDNIKIPESIQNLSPKQVKTSVYRKVSVYLEVCTFDSKVILVIDVSKKANIYVVWGETGVTEIYTEA